MNPRDRLAAAEIGRRLTRATSTITRRGDLPVDAWPFKEVLILARNDERLAAATVSYLTSQQAPVGGLSSNLASDVAGALTKASALAADWMAASADGKVDRTELRALLMIADAVADQIDGLRRDLRAALAETRT